MTSHESDQPDQPPGPDRSMFGPGSPTVGSAGATLRAAGPVPSADGTWTAAPDVLAGFDDSPRKRAPWLLVGGVAVLVAALVGGVTYGVGALSGGGGSQPESALPSGAFAFLKVDLDPAAGQKIDGFRFMRKFPALKDKLGARDDLREVVFEAVAEEAGWSDVDFGADVEPWLGQRVAVAAYPPAPGAQGSDGMPAEPRVVVAVQVTDADAARPGLDRLVRAATSQAAGSPGFVVNGDYALLAETQALADDAASEVDAGVLADDGKITEDLEAAPDGVITAWVDTEPMVAALGGLAGLGGFGGMSGLTGGAAAGRSTVVARFDGPDAFEVTGTTVGGGVAGWATHPVQGMAELPETSIVALGLADGELFVPRMMDELRRSLDATAGPAAAEEGALAAPSFDEVVASAEQSLGLDLPDDLAVLLGDNLVAALDGTQGPEVQVGARVRTDADRAERVLDALTQSTGGGDVLRTRRAGDDLVFASTEKQVGRLAAAGTLGQLAGFQNSLPDLADADLAVWVDVAGASTFFDGLFAEGSQAQSPVDENIAPISGLGISASSSDDGSGSFRLRLVTN